MSIFNKKFILNEKYVSKYAQYLDDDDDKDEDNDDDEDEDDDEEDDEEDNKKEKTSSKSNDKKSSSSDSKSESDKNKSEEKKEQTPEHLTKEEIRRIMTIATSTLMDFPKLKRCCDYADLNDKDHINDEGERESSFGKYYSSSPKAFIELMNGDTYSGYPDFKDHGSENYEKDAHNYVKKVNEILEDRNIKAKFMVGPDREDDAISFGVKSTKGN